MQDRVQGNHDCAWSPNRYDPLNPIFSKNSLNGENDGPQGDDKQTYDAYFGDFCTSHGEIL